MLWVNVVTSLATVVVTLAAVYAAARWKERGDDRAWLRQERLAAYQSLLVKVDRLVGYAYDAVAASDNDPTERKDAIRRLIESNNSLDRAASRVGLVGSLELARLGHQIGKQAYYGVVHESVRTARVKPSDPEWVKAVEALVDQYKRFRALARIDLGADQRPQDIPTAWAAESEAGLQAALKEQDGSNQSNRTGGTK
jgi:hypothetical protein